MRPLLIAAVMLVVLQQPVIGAADAARQPADPPGPTDVAVFTVGFDPAVVTVPVGHTVRWRWTSGSHTVTADDQSFDSGVLGVDDTFEVTFDTPGDHPYYCAIHSSSTSNVQNGVIRVLPGDAGTDPVALALGQSSTRPAGTVDTVFLASSDAPADALATGGAQRLLAAPLLLTPPDELDPRVADELDRLGAARVLLVGGPAAVAERVVEAMTAKGLTVERVAGATRVGTAVALADRVSPATAEVVLAAESAAADAVVAGAVAANLSAPVLLVPATGLPALVGDYLDRVGARTVTIVGGTSRVPTSVADALAAEGLVVHRIEGPDRFATAAAAATNGAGPPLLLTGEHKHAWASGLAAVGTAAGRPLLLAADDRLPPSTFDALSGDTAPECGPLVAAPVCATADQAARSTSAGVALLEGDRSPGHAALEVWTSDVGLCLRGRLLDLEGAAFGVAVTGPDGARLGTVPVQPGEEVADCVTGITAAPHDLTLTVPTAAHPTGEITGRLTPAGA